MNARRLTGRVLVALAVAAGVAGAVAVQSAGDRFLTLVLVVPGAAVGVLAARRLRPPMHRYNSVAEIVNDIAFVGVAVAACALLVWVAGPAGGLVVGLLGGFFVAVSWQ